LPIRGSPNGIRNTRPQPGRDPPEWASRSIRTAGRNQPVRPPISPMAISPSPLGAQQQHPSKRWSRSKVRWAIEDSFETAKNEFGLDHNESRSWHGWHRHVSMVMLAFAMMAVIRHRANPVLPKKTQRRTTAKTKASPHFRWSIKKVRRIATRLARKRIQPAHFIAWSLWRRAHQAAAQRTHFKAKRQL